MPTARFFPLLCALLGVLLMPSLAQSQTTIRVLGVGKVAFDVDLALADAQAQTIKAFVPSTAATGIVVTTTCAAAPASATGPVSTCTFNLSALPLTATAQSLALTASAVAADGTVETAKVTAPFVLSLVGPPVAPRPAMSIRPAP